MSDLPPEPLWSDEAMSDLEGMIWVEALAGMVVRRREVDRWTITRECAHPGATVESYQRASGEARLWVCRTCGLTARIFPGPTD